MKMISTITAAVALLTLLGAGCASAPDEFELPPASRELTLAESNRKTPVKTGEYVMITLKENPTTGYCWFFKVDDGKTGGAIEIVGERFIPPERMIPGAGGVRQVMIRAVRPGVGVLTGNCMRPWEKRVAPLTSVKYTFEVAP